MLTPNQCDMTAKGDAISIPPKVAATILKISAVLCALVWFGTNGTVWCDACNATTRNEHIFQAASYDLAWLNVCVYYLASIRPRHEHHQQQR